MVPTCDFIIVPCIGCLENSDSLVRGTFEYEPAKFIVGHTENCQHSFDYILEPDAPLPQSASSTSTLPSFPIPYLHHQLHFQ